MQNLLSHHDIQFIIEQLKQANQIALSIFHLPTIDKGSEIKKDKSIVTRADKDIEHFLRAALGQRFPHIALVGEEEGGQLSPPLWAIDPIDGTSSFFHGLPLWTISLGLMNKNSLPVAGFVTSPTIHQIIWINADNVLHQMTYSDAPESNIIQSFSKQTTTTSFHNESQIAVPSGFHRRFGFTPDLDCKIRSMGSTALHGSLVATGQLDCAFIGRPRLWDIAAAWSHLIAVGKNLYYPKDRTKPTKTDWLALNLDYFFMANAERPVLIAGTESQARELAHYIQWPSN